MLMAVLESLSRTSKLHFRLRELPANFVPLHRTIITYTLAVFKHGVSQCVLSN